MSRIQIFSPHPDDVELFVGGTLLKHIHDKDQIQIVLMTHGEMGTLDKSMQGEKIKKIREKEMADRMQLIPAVDLLWLNFPDGSMQATQEGIVTVLKTIMQWKPDIVYLPEIDLKCTFRDHPDHIATGQIVLEAAKQHSQPLILRYYHTYNYTILVDITPYYAENKRALKCYKSQYLWNADSRFLLYGLQCTRYIRTKWWGLKNKTKYAEAFREQRLNFTDL